MSLYVMVDPKKIHIKLADVTDTLAKEAHGEWEALGNGSDNLSKDAHDEWEALGD